MEKIERNEGDEMVEKIADGDHVGQRSIGGKERQNGYGADRAGEKESRHLYFIALRKES